MSEGAMSEARRTFSVALLIVLLSAILYAIHPTFFVRDDFQLQYLPASHEVTSAWSSGEVPLLSRFSWVCSALGAEYQFGVFSLFRALVELLVWMLPLSLNGRGATLVILHVAVAGAGIYRLARSYGATPSAAVMAAVAASLNGWTLWWATTWFPAVASFAWLPWYWLGLRGVVSGVSRWSWAGAAISLYLLVTAGWPYSVAMAALVAAMHVLTAVALQRWRAALLLCGASLLGLALAAPAALMLLEYFPYTARTAAAVRVESAWFVPVAALFGVIVPAFSVSWPVFSTATIHPAVELLGAFVPLAAIAAAFGRPLVKKHLPELILLLVLLALVLLPSGGPFRWSFRWLPLAHLALAVVGAVALGAATRWRAAWCGAALAGVTMGASLLLDQQMRTTLLHGALLIAACAAWGLLEKRGSRLPLAIPVAMPAAISAAMILLTFTTFRTHSDVPSWREEPAALSPAPFERGRRYLALYSLDAVIAPGTGQGIHPELRPGSMPMLAGVEFVNGYSPLGPASLKNVFRFDPHGPIEDPREARRILLRDTGPGQLLDHLGVHGLLVPESLAREQARLLSSRGWRPVARLATCLLLHRGPARFEPLYAVDAAIRVSRPEEAYATLLSDRGSRALPVLLLGAGESRVESYDPRPLTKLQEARHETSFVVRGTSEKKMLVVFRRPWLPGWRATVGGEPLPVLRAQMFLPAVEIPGDRQGAVRLVYRPDSLVRGLWLAGAALFLIALFSILQVRATRRDRQERGGGAPRAIEP